MTPSSLASTRSSGGSSSRWWTAVLLVAALFMSNVMAQAPAAQGGATPALSAEELEKLVGPIALYPDDLVAIILPAATNPLQVVQADRFLDKRKTDPKLPVDEKWDDAVKSLLNYPEVVKKMSTDLDWTAALGEAVVADQGDVLEAVQAFRRKTQAAGNLKTDDKQTVVVEKEVITIAPTNPEVIYVPQYDPSTVVVYGGYSSWGYWPAPYPVYYYPYAPGAAFATGLIWGAAISNAWNGGRYATHYGGNANINIDRNTNINTGDRNFNRGGGSASQRPAGGSTQWKSDKKPGQVSNTLGKSPSTRVGDPRGGTAGGGAAPRASTQPSAGGAGARGGGAAPRASTQPSGGAGRSSSGGYAGAARGSSGGYGGAGGSSSAFDSYGSGRQTQMDSSRGASSRSSMSGGGARSSPSTRPSGGARSGGGGGRGGGGRR